jgi:microcystin-dependent protein
MNKNQKLLVFLFIIVISVFVFTYMIPSNKEDFQSNFNFNEVYIKGEQGARGPMGPAGEPGPKGDAGPACKNIINYLEKRGHLSLGETSLTDTIDVSSQLELKGNIINKSANFSKLKITDYNECYPIMVGNNETDAHFYLKKNPASCDMFLRGNLEITGKLTFRDINNSQQSIDASSIFYSLAPVGLIANFYTTASQAIPINWAICNGQVVDGFQTPDLRGKFVRGTDSLSENGTTNDTDFNEETRFKDGNIILTEANLPSHTHSPATNRPHSHTVSVGSAGSHTHNFSIVPGTLENDENNDSITGNNQFIRAGSSGEDPDSTLSPATNAPHRHALTINNAGSHTHTVNSAGSGEAFNILPPYMSLVYIIKYK